MAGRKKKNSSKKPQYVRAKKRSGSDSSAVARRSVTIGLLVVIFGGVIFGVIQGLNWIGRKLYSENPRFELRHLVVKCDGKLSEDYIREVIEIKEGMNLWEFTFGDIEKRLMGVSRVESVYLERDLPDALIVKVKERVAVAQIIGRKATRYPYLVDRFGYVLPPRLSATDLPVIEGLDIDLQLGEHAGHADVETALQIIGMCDSNPTLHKYIKIQRLDVKYGDYIHMYLDGDTRVRMPRHSLEKKLINLSSTIKIGLARGERYREIDMTLDSPKAVTVPF